MRKTGGVFLSMVNLDRQNPTPMTRQLENQLRKAVLDGVLPQGTRLPSTRQLALDLGVSRLTIKNAFEQLTSEGFLETRHGSGTYVATLSSGDLAMPEIPVRRRKRSPRRPAVSSHVDKIRTSRATTRLSHVRAFRPGIPALDLFPRRAWAEAQSRAIRSRDDSLLGYGASSGLEDLKTQIASHVRDSRGIDCVPEQIIVTSGAQQAFSLILLTLMRPGNSIWMEDPGHIAFVDAATLQGYRVDPVPLDHEGVSLDYALSQYPLSNLIFVTPSHQHPMGMTMSLSRRLDLLEVAHGAGAWIVEDDYDSEFHYEERPQPALKALDTRDCVLYIGSFSKSMFPAMRLGYLICPPDLAPAFAAAETLLNQNVSLLTQQAMAFFMEDGSFNAHIRRMRSAYKARRDLLVAALEDEASHILRPDPCRAGMHLVARFVDPTVSDMQMAQALWDAGIDCLPIDIFRHQHKGPPGLLLGFACAPEQEIHGKVAEAVKAMERVLP